MWFDKNILLKLPRIENTILIERPIFCIIIISNVLLLGSLGSIMSLTENMGHFFDVINFNIKRVHDYMNRYVLNVK